MNFTLSPPWCPWPVPGSTGACMVSYEHMCPQHCIVQYNGTFLPIVTTFHCYKDGSNSGQTACLLAPLYQDPYQELDHHFLHQCWGFGWRGFGESGSLLHVLLAIGSVAHLVELGDMFADVFSVKQHRLLANVAGMVNQLDDLSPGFSKLCPILSQSQFVFVSYVLPQSWHGVDGVADTAEHFDWQKRIIAKLLGSLHFARFFWNILTRNFGGHFVLAGLNGSFGFAHSQVDCFAWSFEKHFGLGIFSTHLHWRTVGAELMPIQKNVQIFIRNVPGWNSSSQVLTLSLNCRKPIIGFKTIIIINSCLAKILDLWSWEEELKLSIGSYIFY